MNPRLVALALFAGALACTSALPQPTQADAAKAAERWPGTTQADLARGRGLYVDKCAGCHALKAPNEVPVERWIEEIEEMRKEHDVALSDSEAQAILVYLVGVGSR